MVDLKGAFIMKYLIKQPQTFVNTLNDEIGSILHKTFDNMFPEYLFNVETDGFAMPVDIKEYDDSYCICVEIPGVKKEDIDIDLTKTTLKISAKKDEEKEEKSKKYHKSEFRYGFYSRTIQFPQDVDIEKTKAKLVDGILKMSIPKIEAKKDEDKKKINIE